MFGSWLKSYEPDITVEEITPVNATVIDDRPFADRLLEGHRTSYIETVDRLRVTEQQLLDRIKRATEDLAATRVALQAAQSGLDVIEDLKPHVADSAPDKFLLDRATPAATVADAG